MPYPIPACSSVPYYDGATTSLSFGPATRGMVVPADSITLQLYYLQLTQTAPETRLEPIRIRPNPATDHILLSKPAKLNPLNG